YRGAWGSDRSRPGRPSTALPLVEGAQIQPPQEIPDGAHRVILRHQAIRVDRPQDDLVAVDGLQPQLRFGRREGWEGAADCSFSPSTSTVCSASMRPRFPPSDRRSTPNRQGALVLDHPLDLLALLQLQRFGQGGGADQVELAVATGPLDQLHALSIGSPWPENCTTSHRTSQENFFQNSQLRRLSAHQAAQPQSLGLAIFFTASQPWV